MMSSRLYVRGFCAAAFFPAILPKVMHSGMALLPSRLAPCTPPVTSPAA